MQFGRRTEASAQARLLRPDWNGFLVNFRIPREHVAAGAADASRAMLTTLCRKVALLTAICAFL